ncbi:MAG: sulfite exporter TauE/SafE family protein [Rhodospirillales bacterium]|nr:sulfite exporter TauE/SafE family protein [Rhodospirillales bacterium]
MISIVAGSGLFIAAFFTAVFSAVAGVGGGMMMFAAVAVFLDFALVMPVFGAVQTSSGLSRVWFFRKYLNWSMILIFGIGFIPAVILGGFAWAYIIDAKEIQPYIKILIAVYILLFLIFPKFRVPPGNRTRILLVMGLSIGFAALTIGAVGAITAPFIEALQLKKEDAIAAIGVGSSFANIAKLPLFFIIFDQLDLSVVGVIGFLILATVFGIYFGKRIQDNVSEDLFRRLFRFALGGMAIKLLVWDGLRVVMA